VHSLLFFNSPLGDTLFITLILGSRSAELQFKTCLESGGRTSATSGLGMSAQSDAVTTARSRRRSRSMRLLVRNRRYPASGGCALYGLPGLCCLSCTSGGASFTELLK
jgi:hypothetical protein